MRPVCRKRQHDEVGLGDDVLDRHVEIRERLAENAGDLLQPSGPDGQLWRVGQIASGWKISSATS